MMPTAATVTPEQDAAAAEHAKSKMEAALDAQIAVERGFVPYHRNIWAALAAAQAEMKNPKKDQTAEIQSKSGAKYGYQYVDLATVIETVRGPLTKNGIAFIQRPTFHAEAGMVEVETLLVHGSSDTRESVVLTLPSGAAAQEIGSAITYARRYGIQSLCGIFAEEDDDGAAAHASAPQSASRTQGATRPAPRPPAKASDTPALEFFRLLNKLIASGKIEGRAVVNLEGKRTLIENLVGEPLDRGPLEDVMTPGLWQKASAGLLQMLEGGADANPVGS